MIDTVTPINIKQDSILHNVIARFVKLPSEHEDIIARGAMLNKVGVRLSQAYGGVGYDESIRYFPDMASRVYLFEEYKEEME